MHSVRCWTAVGLACFGAVMLCDVHTAQATPLYMTVFKEVYPNWDGDTTKCAICHFGTSKKNRNDYGKAVEEALGAKNVKDKEKIKEALKKAEDKLPKPKPKPKPEPNPKE